MFHRSLTPRYSVSPRRKLQYKLREAAKHHMVLCLPFGTVCYCNRDYFKELKALVKNCQVYLPFLSFDNLCAVSDASEYEAALDQLFIASLSLETMDRPYAYINKQMNHLQDLLCQLSSAPVIKNRFINRVNCHKIVSADNLALVVLANLSILFDRVQNVRSTLELAWWDFLDQSPKNTEKLLIGIMNEKRSSPDQYWKRLPNISFHDFSTLGVGRWLNDEILNYFIDKWCRKAKDTLGFSTFFGTNCLFEPGTSCTEAKRDFTAQDEDRVRRWVRGRQKVLGLETWDAVFIPIHEKSSHWYSAYIDFRLKRIEIYDSLEETCLTNRQKPISQRKNTHLLIVLMWLTEVLGRIIGEPVVLKNNPQTEWDFDPHSKANQFCCLTF
ncbi:hypothetical protein EV360DRAFT_87753 [Lentinula raphanica]|nr:hypothetical protein EV360DRAFT_87753 [Lentinula raphanica]